MERTVREVGRLDVLVNNAGVEFGGTFFEVTPEVWDIHLEVNLRAMFFTTQAAARHMKHHGGGAVVNIASVQGAIFNPRYIPYTVSKSGVRGLTSVLAVALAPHRIRVNAVAPGWCNTAMNKLVGDDGPDSPHFRERLRLIPLSRIGEPEDMAEAVIFLASARSGVHDRADDHRRRRSHPGGPPQAERRRVGVHSRPRAGSRPALVPGLDPPGHMELAFIGLLVGLVQHPDPAGGPDAPIHHPGPLRLRGRGGRRPGGS